MTALVITEVFPPRPGGSGRWLWELYRRLGGVDVKVLAGETAGAAEFDRAAPLAITRLALSFPNWGVLHWQGLQHYVRRVHEIRRVVAHDHPDALHCGKCLPEGLLALFIKAWTKTPFIVYVHGEELSLAKTSRELSFLTGRVLRGAQIVVANSAHTKRLLTADWQLPAERIHIMHPGVDSSRFVPAPRTAAVRRRLGWGERPVILTVGELRKRKGQDMMIRALPAIRAACPDVLYAMVGQGEERAALERLAAEQGVAGHVEFRGVPPDAEMIECYQQCDLFALPNRQVGWDFEGFGIVSLEAQSCGKPVVVGSSGGTTETVQPSLTGDVVSGDSPGELAEVVTRLLQDRVRRERMGKAARQWVVDRFDWQVLGRQATDMFLAG